jgi:hypothetical protein
MWSHNQVPNNLTTYNYIKTQCNWEEAVSSFKRNNDEDLDLRIKNLFFDTDKVLQEVYELYREVGAVNWQSQNSLGLYGLALSYNPSLPKELMNKGCFGTPRYKIYSSKEYFEAVMADKTNHVKNDFFDSLGFDTLLPQIKAKKNLNKLLKSFKLPVIKVTVRTINGILSHSTDVATGGYHLDDCPFETLRINISLSNNGNFGLQYKHKKVVYTGAGDNLVVNTGKLHRSYVKEANTNFQRTNLIVNLAPWLDYNSTNRVWSLNKYFNKVHPFDIVKEKIIL